MSERIAFYGSLLRSFGVQRRLGISSRLRLIGPCLLSGRLFDLGPYPACLPGGGRVRGELYELLDAELIALLDRFEGFDPSRPRHSLYLRRRLRLIEPAGLAWAYVYNRSVEGLPLVGSGCWECRRRELRSDGTPSS